MVGRVKTKQLGLGHILFSMIFEDLREKKKNKILTSKGKFFHSFCYFIYTLQIIYFPNSIANTDGI